MKSDDTEMLACFFIYEVKIWLKEYIRSFILGTIIMFVFRKILRNWSQTNPKYFADNWASCLFEESNEDKVFYA